MLCNDVVRMYNCIMSMEDEKFLDERTSGLYKRAFIANLQAQLVVEYCANIGIGAISTKEELGEMVDEEMDREIASLDEEELAELLG